MTRKKSRAKRRRPDSAKRENQDEDGGRSSAKRPSTSPTSSDRDAQTSSRETKDQETQTDHITQASQQTQTEPEDNKDATEAKGDHDDNEKMEAGSPALTNKQSEGENEEGKTRGKDVCEKPDEGSAETREKHSREDPEKNLDTKRSYAEVASANQSRESETKNQTSVAQKRQEPERKPPSGATGQPMFTFYIYAVLDKYFRFNPQSDSVWLYCDGGQIRLKTTEWRSLNQEGCLFDGSFSIEEPGIRGQIIRYQYFVQQGKKEKIEMATRYITIPTDNSVKELHLYEGLISCLRVNNSMLGLATRWFRKERGRLVKEWESAAGVLLDRVFAEWSPCSPERTQTLTQQLKHYITGFQPSPSRRIEFPVDLNPYSIPVKKWISSRLVEMLNKESQSRSSDISSRSLEVALSVFQTCNGCGVDLEVRDWARLCQLVGESAALVDLQKVHLVEFSVVGLMNFCAQKQIAEVILLVSVLHSCRKMEDSGSLLDEATWAKLRDIRYLQFREKIRTSSDKRRRVLQLIKDHLHLTRESPDLLKSWISMLAFEDVPEFASLTGIDVDLVLQNLKFRVKEIEENFNYNHSAQSLEAVEKVLRLLLEKVTRERIVESKSIDSILQCCHAVHRSSRSVVKLVPQYRVAVVSLQLLLQTVEIQHAALSQDGEEAEEPKKQLLDKVSVLQKEFCEWRDELLKKPLVQRDASSFTYPRELQMWSDLFGIEISIPEVSSRWEGALDRGLRSRVSKMSDFQKVSVCYLKETADIVEKSHGKVQACFKDSCLAAIKNLCQTKQEGSVLAQLFDKHPSSPIISFFIVESAVRLEEDRVACLLDPQSAISFLLAQEGNWSQLRLDEAAGSLISSCRSSLSSLIHSLCQGDLLLGQLKTILRHKAQFVKLYHKHKALSQEHSISVGVSELLLQREKDLEALDEQKSHMSILINMLGKISDVISVPDSARLEKLIKTNQLDKPLNSLVEVQSGFCKEDVDKTKTRRVLFYTVNQLVQDMALEMSSAKNSNIVLSLWQQTATGLVNGKNDSEPLSLDFSELHHHIWRPCFHNFLKLGRRIASGEACFDEVNQILECCGDHGEEDSLRTELVLLAGLLRLDSDQNWPEHRLSQIMEYKLLYDTAETAKVVLKIKHRLELKGDFSEIQILTEVKDDAYKQCTLGSLSDDLIRTSRMLASVKKQHRACLEAFLQSTSLIAWVKSQIERFNRRLVHLLQILQLQLFWEGCRQG